MAIRQRCAGAEVALDSADLGIVHSRQQIGQRGNERDAFAKSVFDDPELGKDERLTP